MQLSVVVPVYNGEKTLPELFAKLKIELEGKYSHEIIFVNDCGKDGSEKIIKGFAEGFPETVKTISLEVNMGQHNAILKGIAAARGEFIVTLDEDLQHDPEYISVMKEKQEEGDYDVIYAKFRKLKHPGLRIRLSDLLRVLLKNIVPGISPDYSPYRIIKRDTAMKILTINKKYAFIDGYLGMVTDSFGYIDAEHHRRADGRSSYSYYRLLRHALMIAVYYGRRGRRR